MIYYGVGETETILFHAEDNADDIHFIEMHRSAVEPVFYVRTCCDEDWEWAFYDSATNYEAVKHEIIDAAFSCDNMEDVMYELDEIFEEVFGEIAVWDDCDECCCENCDHRDCLN